MFIDVESELNLTSTQFMCSVLLRRVDTENNFITTSANVVRDKPEGILRDIPVEICGVRRKVKFLVMSKTSYDVLLRAPYLAR